MDRYLCIHCHFYQPPRENPWLEAVELQDSAYPYHDWNERIAAESYAPNSASRILDSDNRITKIVNNYGRISFNFGPTLLSWMEENVPETYQAVLDADRESKKSFSGHGSAIAQAYNHLILPLANRRDKHTQILWGIRDFEHRFGREPEGMWLPETAVDLETLQELTELGIRYTILAPHQAKQVRRIGGTRYRNVEGGKIDPTRAYVIRLLSGRSMNLFFYDGPISRAVAFEGLLSNGETFSQRLLSGFSNERTWPQLMHISTDGETYGHHHRHGDMALAYALEYIESKRLAKITNYGEYLEKFPPTHEVQILENTSWSCVHGVERWRSDCGCNSGMKAEWRQHWRAPLRNALDWLRDKLAARYEQTASQYLKDPWAARDEYISVVLDRSNENIELFLARHLAKAIGPNEKTTVLKLLEMQRHLMLMYTSCGWFFDELSGLETVQVIQYAGRAIQLAQELFGDHTEQDFLGKLAEAKSNVAAYGDGAQIYQRSVKPAVLDLYKVAAHYTISSMFDHNADQRSIYCYGIKLHDAHRQEAGKARLALGRAEVCSKITLESAEVTFGVVHFGDHNVNAGVRAFQDEPSYQQMVREVSDAFARADLPESIRLMDRNFGGVSYSLNSLFRDEQRRVVRQILDSTLAEAGATYRQIYEHHAPLMRFLSDLGTPPPKVLQITAEFVLNSSLRRAFEEEDFDLGRVAALLDAAVREKITLDAVSLSFVLKNRLETMADQLLSNTENIEFLERFEAAVRLSRSLPFEVDLWKVQNVYYKLLSRVCPQVQARADTYSQEWLRRFLALGSVLGLHCQVPTSSEPQPVAA
jgi:alpha-amylase/alpha-mannosidase (GH57 family)